MVCATVPHIYNKFHVFGGTDGSTSQTTELISIDGGVEYGPDLPEAVHYHAITSFNSTMSILSGGQTSLSPNSPLTWFFNHETQIFTSGPSLLEGRRALASATVVDKVTQEKIPIVTGGIGNGYVKLDLTELLIEGQWQSGPKMPKALYGNSLLEMQGDVFLFGGYGSDYNSAIYQLSCSSRICSWSTTNQVLKVGRKQSVVIPVSDTLCS